MKLLELFASLAIRIMEWLEDRKRKKTADKKQAQYDAIEKDPVAWFDQHFNGVRDSSEVPRDADKASQADADR